MVTYLTKEQHQQLEQQRAPAAAAAAAAAAAPSAHQFMMNIDMALWRDMCQVVPRGEALMPHRQPAVLPDAAAAGGSSRQRQRR
jgi:hypothetical protein